MTPIYHKASNSLAEQMDIVVAESEDESASVKPSRPFTANESMMSDSNIEKIPIVNVNTTTGERPVSAEPEYPVVSKSPSHGGGGMEE